MLVLFAIQWIQNTVMLYYHAIVYTLLQCVRMVTAASVFFLFLMCVFYV